MVADTFSKEYIYYTVRDKYEKNAVESWPYFTTNASPPSRIPPQR
jgi:hypothetical protein